MEIQALKQRMRRSSSVETEICKRAIALSKEVYDEIHEASDRKEKRVETGSGNLVFTSFAEHVR